MKRTGAEYKVTGMSCAACSARVERAVSSLDGVEECAVDLLSGILHVEGEIAEGAVLAAVRAAGYGAMPFSFSQKQEGEEAGAAKALWRRFLISLSVLLPLVYLSMGAMASLPLPTALKMGTVLNGALQLALALAVLLINHRFFVSGFKALFHLAPNMDTLVSLGAGISFLYSTAVLVIPALRVGHTLYFESAAMILTLITLGKALEARAKGKTTDAVRSLLSLSPERATVVREGREISLPLGEVLLGDLLVLRPGERAAVDGVIERGDGSFDEAALTGESLPVDKGVGDKVYAASVNLSGCLYIRATGVGEDTALSRIVRAVREASSSKAPIAKLADKISGVFVPFVLSVALLTFGGWLLAGAGAEVALSHAIAVLVISCPCALGLATPVAVTVGSGVGAKGGILFKSAAALEETGRIRTVVFDKTGTVTEGKPTVCDVLPYQKGEEKRLISLAYSIEEKSEHPLARAVARYGEENGIPLAEPTDFRAHAGAGVSATLEGKTLVGGRADFVRAFACVPLEAEKTAEKLAEEGKTPLYFALGEEFLGVIAVSDAVKSDSAEAVAALHKMGVRTVMLTGDTEKTALAVAKRVGIDEVVAGVLPEEKSAFIQKEKQKGRVMMVGDGINDAPALVEASVGAAIGCGADIAVDAADAVLSGASLFGVVNAISLSRAVLQNIKQNLFWAFFYNLIGIPLAAGLFGVHLPPAFGAAAMSLSSVTVVSNALRLNFVRFHKPKNEYTDIKDNTETEKGTDKMKTILYIEGMMCPHCSARVQKALEGVEGVSEAFVNHETGTAAVTHENVPEETLKAVVREAGYTVKD